MRDLGPLPTSQAAHARHRLPAHTRSRAARSWRALARFSFGFMVGALVSLGSSSGTTALTGGLGGLLFLLFPGFVRRAFDRVPNWLATLLDVI